MGPRKLSLSAVQGVPSGYRFCYLIRLKLSKSLLWVLSHSQLYAFLRMGTVSDFSILSSYCGQPLYYSDIPLQVKFLSIMIPREELNNFFAVHVFSLGMDCKDSCCGRWGRWVGLRETRFYYAHTCLQVGGIFYF